MNIIIITPISLKMQEFCDAPLMVSLRICTLQMQYECMVAAVGFSTTCNEDLHQGHNNIYTCTCIHVL